MKARLVVLYGNSSERDADRQVIDVDGEDPALCSEQIRDALAAWTLAPGDVIYITEA